MRVLLFAVAVIIGSDPLARAEENSSPPLKAVPESKAEPLLIPHLKLKHKLPEAGAIVQAEIRKVAPPDSPAEGLHSNLVLLTNRDPEFDDWNPTIQLEIRDVPAIEAMRYVSDQSGLVLRHDPHARVLADVYYQGPDAPAEHYQAAFFRVRVPGLEKREIRGFLEAKGVVFQNLRQIDYDPERGQLMVSPLSLDAYEKIRATIASIPPPELPEPLLEVGERTRLDGRDKAFERVGVILENVVLKQVEIRGGTLEEAVEELLGQLPEASRFKASFEPNLPKQHQELQLDLRHIPLGEVLRYLTIQADVKLEQTPDGIVFYRPAPPRARPPQLSRQTFVLPEPLYGEFLADLEFAESQKTPVPDPNEPRPSPAAKLEARLTGHGYPLPEGASFSFDPESGRLEAVAPVEVLEYLQGMLEEIDESRRYRLSYEKE